MMHILRLDDISNNATGDEYATSACNGCALKYIASGYNNDANTYK